MEIHEPSIGVEVVYALPRVQTVRKLTLPAGSTVEQAIEASGIISLIPEINLQRNRLGVYGKLVSPDTLLRDHDRVEIYRPLIVDPKENRRRRAKNLSRGSNLQETQAQQQPQQPQESQEQQEQQ